MTAWDKVVVWLLIVNTLALGVAVGMGINQYVLDGQARAQEWAGKGECTR